MKFAAIALLSFFLIGKDKPAITVNPAYYGTYTKSAEGKDREWTLKPGNKPDRINFYHNNDTDNFLFFVVMKDSTHFTTKGEFAEQPEGQPTRYWSAKGEFLPGGQMSLAVKISDAIMKLTVDLEGQPKVLYVKQ